MTHGPEAEADWIPVEQATEVEIRRKTLNLHKGGQTMAITKAIPDVGALTDQLTVLLTPSTAEVADWHYLDITLAIDRSRPLIELLFDLAFEYSEQVVDLRDPARELADA